MKFKNKFELNNLLRFINLFEIDRKTRSETLD